jgi:hypothetical protein
MAGCGSRYPVPCGYALCPVAESRYPVPCGSSSWHYEWAAPEHLHCTAHPLYSTYLLPLRVGEVAWDAHIQVIGARSHRLVWAGHHVQPPLRLALLVGAEPVVHACCCGCLSQHAGGLDDAGVVPGAGGRLHRAVCHKEVSKW